MAEIRIENVTKAYGDVVAVNNFSLTVNDGELVVLLGPSGCGKTTLLRAIAGLGDLDVGRIFIGDRDITYLQPKDRELGMIFQSYALYPHLSVRENIGFALKLRRAPKQLMARRIDEAATLLQLTDVLDRQPSTLSGGQRQRVAIARAIANQAQVLLMDEPLSNLDVLLRAQMRVDLKRLLRTIKTTTLYVTHDQTEAMNMGDRIAIMNQGELMQIDTPTAIYDLPETQFIAGFIGHPPMNFLYPQVRRHNGTVKAYLGDFEIEPPAPFIAPLRRYEGDEVILGIRAENIMAYDAPTADALPATVTAIDELGAKNLLTTGVGAETVIVSTLPSFPARINGPIWLQFPPDKIRWMDRETGRALKPDLEISAAE